MTLPLRSVALCAVICAALFGSLAGPHAVSAAAPSPSPSPTPVPTPYMALEQIPNGTWDIIMQGRDQITYSTMKLRASGPSGTTINGTWIYNKKTTYGIAGTRNGSKLKLDVKASTKADAATIGKVDATIDGIADMIGSITLNGVETVFQGAQHSRVPAPVETREPAATPSPY